MDNFRCRGVEIRTDKKENIIRVINDEKIILETQNPLEAWTIYIQILDCKIRKELESWCIKHNRDPTTGEWYGD